MRRLYYNLTVSVVCVVAALGGGSVVLLQLLAERRDLTEALVGWLGRLDLRHAGFVLVAALILWLASLGASCRGRLQSSTP